MLPWRTFAAVPQVRRRNVSVTTCARKNNWCLVDPKLLKFSLRFGISLLKVTAGSQRISVMLQERQIIQTGKQCKKCATASEPHRQDPFYHLLPFSSPLFCLFDALSASNLSKARTRDPSSANETQQWVFGFGRLHRRLFKARRSRCPCEATASLQMRFGQLVLFTPCWQHISAESKRERKLK